MLDLFARAAAIDAGIISRGERIVTLPPVPYAQACNFLWKMGGTQPQQSQELLGINLGQVRDAMFGAAVARSLMEEAGASQIDIHRYGLRFGALTNWLRKGEASSARAVPVAADISLPS